MKHHLFSRVVSLLLVLVMAAGFVTPAYAAGRSDDSQRLSFRQTDGAEAMQRLGTAPEDSETPEYADTDMVRVSIVLDKPGTIEAGYSVEGISANAEAAAYRGRIAAEQSTVTAHIDRAISGRLDVVWNMTLAANMISANVAYGQIDSIRKVSGVRDVVIENRYEPCVVPADEADDPNMATSGKMIGSNAAWAAGYTGAGSRIAVIDTGIDTDHQSFSAGGFNYSLAHQAGLAGKSVEEYLTGLDLLDREEITSVLSQLNISADPDKLYLSAKIPFAFNYVDTDYDVTHDNDSQGEHGSHVEGIAAANAYIPNGDGTFSNALSTVKVQGVAPDAQIIAMKVFGKGGGAYDSDYMVAIEDAIVLGADSINLSLGSSNPGFSRHATQTYQAIMDNLNACGAVVTISAGNSSGWSADDGNTGYLYADEVSMDTLSAPASYTNSLSVASVDNTGFTGQYIQCGDSLIFYAQTAYSNEPLSTLAGSRDYILIDGVGTEEEFAALKDVLTGKIAVCSRGEMSFYEKAEAAVENGAIATVIYNNQPGALNLDLSSYDGSAPVVSVTQADGALLRSNAAPVKGTDGSILYYQGTLTVSQDVASVSYDPAYYTMSSFSSWGVPGSLQLKPEITAPGGNIYSVNGAEAGGTGYESMSGTSMAAPQVAGMAALAAQYIRQTGLDKKTGLTPRQLATSLLMSTAAPMHEEASGGNYWSVLRQGAGLANISDAITSGSYIRMDDGATSTAADGKVKAELGDDPQRTGAYSFGFTLHNFSGETEYFTLSADLFTQALLEKDGASYMDTRTTPLAADVTFTVDGKTFVPTAAVECDLDHDGDTDADDAQIILNYAVGLKKKIDSIADVDGDGSVTTYDAYLLLKNLETSRFAVPAGSAVKIQVSANLTDTAKKALDAGYPNGAYVEGYVYAKPVSTTEGVLCTAHSIPVLGYYGSWSEPSMYDKGSYTSRLYGDTAAPHTGVNESNNLVIRYHGDSTSYYQTGNPYLVEDAYPEGRAAINSADTLFQYKLSMIRNAAATALVITDQDGKVLHTGSVIEQYPGTFYSSKSGSWVNASTALRINKKTASLNVKEGDVIRVSVVSVPEYYEDGRTMTAEDVTRLMQDGTLKQGAFLTTTLTVDNTAPEISDISKSLTTGNLQVTARDNNYIACIRVVSSNGRTVYAQALPQAEKAGEKTTTTIDLSKASVGPECTVIVGDYAGNETAYTVKYGGAPEDFTGRMFGFTSAATRETRGQRWVEIDPMNLYYDGVFDYGGLETYYTADTEVYAAEYVAGYVFYADKTDLYVAPQDDLSAYMMVAGNYTTATGGRELRDMAYNSRDGKLYALGYENKFYTVDLVTGALEQAFTVDVTNPKGSSSTIRTLRGFTIDDSGNFYAVNTGANKELFLYKWSMQDVSDGAVTGLPPVINDKEGYLYGQSLYCTSNISLAWDHENNVLYLASGYGNKNSADGDNELWIIDTQTGKADHPNPERNGMLRCHVTGLYVVPSGSQGIKQTDTALGIQLNQTELSLLVNSSYSMQATVFPWNLADKSVTWSSSDPAVAAVDANGVVTTLTTGQTVITAATNAAPNLTASCTITVEKLADTGISALITGSDRKTHWAEFRTDSLPHWDTVADAGRYYGGTLCGDMLVVHDGSAMFGVDPDTFQVTPYGPIASTWQWSDAAYAAREGKTFGKLFGISNEGTFLEILDAAAGQVNYWDLTEQFADDPMAVIAYWRSEYWDHDYDYDSNDWPARIFYMMTESGALYTLSVYTSDKGKSYGLEVKKVGDSGIQLTGVSSVTGGVGASMLFDETTGNLLISSYQEGSTAQLYALDPVRLIPALVGEFGENAYPVTALYQYDRATDLTLRMDTGDVQLYAGDTKQIPARVVLGATNALTWTSDNEAVATVDANGVVTGVSKGTAKITATTVDTDKNGQHLTASVNVTVEALTQLTGTVGAQITTGEGETSWVDIDLASRTATAKKTGGAALTGGGLGTSDAIYGTDVNLSGEANGNMYRVDVSTLEETVGSSCSVYYAALDVARMPAQTFQFTTGGQTYTNEVPEYPFYIAASNYSGVLKDYANGTISGFYTQNTYTDLAAIAYVGSVATEKGYSSWNGGYDAGTMAAQYIVLGGDGSLYLFELAPLYNARTSQVGFSLTYGPLAQLRNIGRKFEDRTLLSMEYAEFDSNTYGLLISDASDGSIYFVNLASGTCGKVGSIAGASNITALYNVRTTASAAVLDTIRMRAGDGQTLSSALSVRSGLPETAVSADADISGMAAADGSTQAFTGTVKAQAPAAQPQGSVAAAADGSVTLTLSDDAETTNGLIKVTYDPSVLTYTGTDSLLSSYAVNNGEKGVVWFDYASASAVAAGSTLATLHFTYQAEYISTVIQVDTLQRGENVNVADDRVRLSVVYEVGGHNWGEWTVTQPATCTQDGQEARTCARCGETETRVITALGHEPQVYGTKAPTCTQEGYTGDTRCARCDALLEQGSVIPAAGHSFGDWETIQAPDCGSAGTEQRTCSVCGYTETRGLDALGHDWDADYTVDQEPTCTQEGSRSIHCKRCGAVKDSQVIPATGHDPEVRNGQSATCTREGYTGDVYCRTCSELLEKGRIIPALGHEFRGGRCVRCGVRQPGAQTGDETAVGLWLTVLASAAVLTAAVALPRRKRSR